MKKVLAILVLIAIVSCESIPINLFPHFGKVKDVETPRYKLDLDVKPINRWDHIVPTFKPTIQRFVKIIDFIGIPEYAFNTLATFAETQEIYREFVQELKGIGQKSETDWKRLLLANFLYDVSAIIPHANFCSSIIALQEDGTCIHGRNLDFWPWGIISKDSAYIDVYKNGKQIATFHQPVGAVMVLSGVRIGSFSVTVDTRKFNHGIGKHLEELIDNIIVKRYTPSTFLTRIVLQTDGITYEQARDTLKNTSTTAPIYYIVAGLNSGSVIEKQPVGYHAIYEIGPNTPNDGEWYIVQTNYDRWEDPGLDDRKTPAEKRLNEIGQSGINLTTLKEGVMLQYPNLNVASIYTSMFYPTNGTNSLKLLYGNINDVRTENDFMDSDLVIFDDDLRESVKQSFYIPEEDILQAAQYLQKQFDEHYKPEIIQEIFE